MINKEYLTINNKKYVRVYSDKKHKIEQDGDLYDEEVEINQGNKGE